MTTCGCEIMIMREPSTSVIVAPARSAIERTTSVPAALSVRHRPQRPHSRHRGEGQLPDKSIHTWHHDAQEQAEQHRQDEAVYSEDSPWRYNDVTSGLGDCKERWNKT